MKTSMTTGTEKVLKLEDIRIDGGTQMRVDLHEATVEEYRELYESGGSLPPVRVVFDGSNYWLWDGFTRLHARRRAGLSDIKAEVQKGTQRDAVLLSCGANAEHGLKRTNNDKRKSVGVVLADKSWGKRSDRWIADQCKVSHEMVRQQRNQLSTVDSCEPREGKDGRSRKLPDKPAEAKAETPPESTPQQQLKDFFKERPAPEPVEEVKQHNVSFDVAAIESQPAPVASIVKDAGGRNVPEHLRADQTGAALLQSLATKVERIRTETNQISGERGVQFFEVHIAPVLDTLQEVKDLLRSAMFACECPACKGTPRPKCKRCSGHGYLPVGLYGKLSKEEQAYLEGK